MLHTRWSAEAWSQVRVEWKKVLALNPLASQESSFGTRMRREVAKVSVR
jgi:hypothetical protein